MKDRECVEFLQWCLPQLRMRWAGYRKVRKQVCKRISRRMNALGLADSRSYKAYIGAYPGEWEILDAMCRVTISRFYRDRAVFDNMRSVILPEIAGAAATRGEKEIRIWSAGCASGEEAYTLKISWKLHVEPGMQDPPLLRIIATDSDTQLLHRAGRGHYSASSLKDLPDELIQNAFDKTEGGYSLRKPFKEGITFIEQDIRKNMPEGAFHLVLCRNLVLTYFDNAMQTELVDKITEKLIPGGLLIIGIHEALPQGCGNLIQSHHAPCIYRRNEK